MHTNKMTRAIFALSAAAALLPTLAGAQSAPQMPAPRAAAAAPSQESITVSYYAGNPAQGGKLLSRVTLQRPQYGPQDGPKGGEPRGPMGQPQAEQPQPGQPDARPDEQRPDAQAPGAHKRKHGHHNPLLAQAPRGATFAIIKDEHGSHIIDLTKPVPRPQGQEGQPLPVPPQR